MDLTAAVASFAVVAGLVTITPGLDTALVVRTASRHGRRPGLATALGISSGVLVWAVVAAIGVSALLTASSVAHTGLRLVGALYMVWLGIGMLRSAFSATDPAPGTLAGTQAGAMGAWRAYRSGLLVNLMNPKVGAFYVALLPQFIPPGHGPAWVGVLLGMVHAAEGLLWFSLLLLVVDRVREFLRRPVVQRWVDGVAGTAVIGFGLALAFDSHVGAPGGH